MPVESVALLLDLPADIRVAIGRPATALDGFRRTHVDALTNATDVVSARFVLARRTIRRHPTRGLDDNRSQSGRRVRGGHPGAFRWCRRGSHEALSGGPEVRPRIRRATGRLRHPAVHQIPLAPKRSASTASTRPPTTPATPTSSRSCM